MEEKSEDKGGEILKTAEECLKKACGEKDEEHRESLMYQFCLQMKRFCNQSRQETESEEYQKKFERYEIIFDGIAKLYKKPVEERG